MKKYIFSLLALLCFNVGNGQQKTLGQIEETESVQNANFTGSSIWSKLTFPVDGTVYQKVNGGIQIDFSGQYVNPVTGRYILKVYKQDSNYGNYNLVLTTDVYNVNSSSQNIISSGSSNTYSFLYQPAMFFSEGWYRASIFPSQGSNPLTTISFGVGDVYFIAGQSNASGFNYHNESEYDESQGVVYNHSLTFDQTKSFLSNTSSSHIARTYNKNGKYEWKVNELHPSYNTLRPVNGIWEGLPFKQKFTILKNGTDRKSDPGRIYPNGMASWNWAPLAHKIATVNKTPTLFFNVAFPGSWIGKSNGGWVPDNINANNNERKKFIQTLSLYGGVIGAKSILWHQGEEDAYNLTNAASGNNYDPDNYKNNLESLILGSREVFNNSNQLSWYISNVSMFTGNSSVQNGSTTSGISPASSLTNLPSSIVSGVTHYYSHSAITSRQSSLFNPSNNIFPGLSNSDNINNESRDDKYRLHFSGDKTYQGVNTLQSVADQWYSSIYNGSNYHNAQGIAPQSLVRLESISGGGTQFTLTYANLAGAEYYFTRNDNGIYENGTTKSFENTNKSNRSFQFSNVIAGDILTCYVKESGSLRFRAGQTFIAMNSNVPPKVLSVQYPTLSFQAMEQTNFNPITHDNVDWEVSSKPSWAEVNYEFNDQENLRISVNSNSGVLRSGTVTLSEVGGGISTSFTITQSGTTTSTPIPLTSLSPTNNSSEWQGYGTARFNGTSIEGQTIRIGQTYYTQGIGTHANSRIVYNLNNNYQTFSCKFGLDWEANCCDGASFTIKADGQTIYGPVTKTWGEEATVVSNLSVAGKSTLELIADQISNNYADHTDWADVYLSTTTGGGGCTTQPTLPTNVHASVGEVSSGGSATLYATCATGTPLWSNQATGSAITVNPTATTNYRVKCTAPNCIPSSEVGLYVVVPSSGNCSNLTNNQTLGSWTVLNPPHPLIVKTFHNQKWLVQRISTNPEEFLVRGSEMLTRGDVTPQYAYSSYVGCFAWTYSNFGGLLPPEVQTQFQTPPGYMQLNEGDGTPYYRYIGGGARISAPDSIIEEPAFIKIVPNPNSGEFLVVVDLAEDSPLDLALINSSGIVFETMNFEGKKGKNTIPYRVSKVGKGNYLMRVRSKDKVETTTVVID